MSPARETSSLPLPEFVTWSVFPFEGEFRVRQPKPPYPSDRPRSGEPGGEPCHSCAAADDEYIWVDEHWRVSAARPSGVPVQVSSRPASTSTWTTSTTSWPASWGG